MIALLPSLRTSTNKKSFLKIDPIKTNQTNSSGINDHFNYSYYNCQQIEAIMKIDNEIRDEINQIKSELMNKSLEIEQKIQNEPVQQTNPRAQEAKQDRKTRRNTRADEKKMIDAAFTTLVTDVVDSYICHQCMPIINELQNEQVGSHRSKSLR